jgi:uncharacterized protein YecT (DUF1311 family)
LVAIAFGGGTSHADELDEWCAQAKKASSIVICSDAELRQQAIARNKLFEAARAKLSSEAYKALSDDQSRWIKSYTTRCGISVDDPPPSMPIPQNVIDCYRRESRSRTAYLAANLSEPNPIAAPPAAATLVPPPAPPSAAASESTGYELFLSCDNERAEATKYRSCLDYLHGVWDGAMTMQFPGQELRFCPKTLVQVGQIALIFENWAKKHPQDLGANASVAAVASFIDAIPCTSPPQVGQGPGARATSSDEASDRDLVKWMDCTVRAVYTLADQPEPAQTVADAVFGSCIAEQFAYQKSAGLSDRQLEADKAAILTPKVLAHVMAVRAARAKLRQESPKAGSAIDYNRM